MPAMDGTGPRGMGPLTGGGRGWCNPYYSGINTLRMASPFSQTFGSGRPSGFGMFPLNPYGLGFRAFPNRPLGFGRGRRRRGW
jgi:hypothetical protein